MVRKSPNILQIINTLAAAGGWGPTILQRRFEKGRVLVGQGAATTNVFVIRSGIVKCFITEENGREYILEFSGEGEVLGELEAIVRMPGMCTAKALSEVHVYQIDKASFLSLLAKEAVFNTAIMEMLAVRLTNTGARASRQQLHSLEHSLDKLLAVLASEKMPVAKQDLADYLGISLRSLNRLLKDRPTGRPG
jgi:CRP-like cAMP-binding protein